MSIPARILPLAAAIAAALVVAEGSTARDGPSAVFLRLSFGTQPTLTVTTASGGSSFVFLGAGGETSGPAAVSIDLAPGYAVPTVAPGAAVGLASFISLTGSQSGSGLVSLDGTLTAADPATYAADPVAQACAPGPYTAVWKLASSALGLNFTLPVFVEHPAGDATRVELRFCPPPLTDGQGKPVTAGPVPLAFADLILLGSHGPSVKGRYVSNAYITPAGPTGEPDQGATVEARALEPVGHTLTLKGRYDKKAHAAVLSGKVVEAGKPQRRATVQFFNTSALTLPKQVRTTTHGTFSTRVRISGPSTFVARVGDAVGPCGGTSTAPAGCASLTVTGTNQASVTVRTG